jgi:hypothetical protein
MVSARERFVGYRGRWKWTEEQLLAIEWELGVKVQFFKSPLTLRGRQDLLLDLLGFRGSRTYL